MPFFFEKIFFLNKSLIINSKKIKETELNGIPIFYESKEILDTIMELGIKVAFLCE